MSKLLSFKQYRELNESLIMNPLTFAFGTPQSIAAIGSRVDNQELDSEEQIEEAKKKKNMSLDGGMDAEVEDEDIPKVTSKDSKCCDSKSSDDNKDSDDMDDDDEDDDNEDDDDMDDGTEVSMMKKNMKKCMKKDAKDSKKTKKESLDIDFIASLNSMFAPPKQINGLDQIGPQEGDSLNF